MSRPRRIQPVPRTTTPRRRPTACSRTSSGRSSATPRPRRSPRCSRSALPPSGQQRPRFGHVVQLPRRGSAASSRTAQGDEPAGGAEPEPAPTSPSLPRPRRPRSPRDERWPNRALRHIQFPGRVDPRDAHAAGHRAGAGITADVSWRGYPRAEEARFPTPPSARGVPRHRGRTEAPSTSSEATAGTDGHGSPPATGSLDRASSDGPRHVRRHHRAALRARFHGDDRSAESSRPAPVFHVKPPNSPLKLPFHVKRTPDTEELPWPINSRTRHGAASPWTRRCCRCRPARAS